MAETLNKSYDSFPSKKEAEARFFAMLDNISKDDKSMLLDVKTTQWFLLWRGIHIRDLQNSMIAMWLLPKVINGRTQSDNIYGNNTHTALWQGFYKKYGEKIFTSDLIGNHIKDDIHSLSDLPPEDAFIKTYCAWKSVAQIKLFQARLFLGNNYPGTSLRSAQVHGDISWDIYKATKKWIKSKEAKPQLDESFLPVASESRIDIDTIDDSIWPLYYKEISDLHASVTPFLPEDIDASYVESYAELSSEEKKKISFEEFVKEKVYQYKFAKQGIFWIDKANRDWLLQARETPFMKGDCAGNISNQIIKTLYPMENIQWIIDQLRFQPIEDYKKNILGFRKVQNGKWWWEIQAGESFIVHGEKYMLEVDGKKVTLKNKNTSLRLFYRPNVPDYCIVPKDDAKWYVEEQLNKTIMWDFTVGSIKNTKEITKRKYEIFDIMLKQKGNILPLFFERNDRYGSWWRQKVWTSWYHAVRVRLIINKYGIPDLMVIDKTFVKRGSRLMKSWDIKTNDLIGEIWAPFDKYMIWVRRWEKGTYISYPTYTCYNDENKNYGICFQSVEEEKMDGYHKNDYLASR